MKTCIAVDMGGTKMLVAEVTEEGKILHQKRYPTGGLGKEQKVRLLLKGVEEYEKEFGWLTGQRPGQIGVGINGVIDPVKGIWKKLAEEEEEVALIWRLEEEMGLTCYIDNDVKCTVIAENRFGAGKGCRDMIYINVGTGLAAGMITGGKLVRGTDGFAGEVGFMNFTGGEGVRVELLASGMGLQCQREALAPAYPDSLLLKEPTDSLSGETVFAAADRGDALANRILEDLVRMNALLISNLTCAFSPEMVVLGGGLITDGRLFDRIVDSVLPKARQHLEKGVLLTGLDPARAGLMGAAAIGLGYQKDYF